MARDGSALIRRAGMAILLAVAALAGIGQNLAQAARFTRESRDAISLQGYIELGDCARWEAFAKPAVKSGAKSVVLNSPGGRDGQGECISRSITALRLKTVVREKCVSICFLLFAAGAERSACKGALIGVHRPSDPGTHAETSDLHYLNSILEYADRYHVPRAIKAKLAATSGREMYYLTKADLESMNVKECL